MLGSEDSWMYDYGNGQQVPGYALNASTHTCTDESDVLASFGLPTVAQEASTTSTIQMTDNQQPLWLDYPALPVDQGIDFDSHFTDTSFSSPTPDLDYAGVESLPAFPVYAPAQQRIDAESFYRNEVSPPIHQHTKPAVMSQDANLFDTNVALSIQNSLHISLRDELERSILNDVPCFLESGAGSVIESGTEPGMSLQLDREQTQHNEERLNKQDERIRELELALQQLQQVPPEPPQEQWIEVQTNVEQYLKRFTEWAEEHRQASAGDAAQVRDRMKMLEAEVRALRQSVDGSG
ncbi:hypothetical protein ACJQWK_04767 [Exserohilum turcicum]